MRILGRRKEGGFTLIELVVAIAILGVLAAIAIPSVLAFLGRGSEQALDTQEKELQQAVDTFKTDLHKGPDTSHNWGTESAQRLFPTEDGKVGDIELDESTTDPDFPDRENFRVKKHVAGPSVGADATDADIKDSAVWMGLLVNEPFNSTGTEQDEPGDVHPQGGEKGQYLLEFPESASETNTDTDNTDGNGNGRTNGTYTWVILKNGRVAPAYKGSDGKWYVGFNDQFP